MPGTLLSSESLEQIRKWQAECARDHSRCQAILDHEYVLPRRVLDLHAFGRKEPDKIRLYESQGENVPYICLSHRWTRRMPATTRANYHARIQAVHIKTLVPHFKDVIFLARFLGIRYLWIDSFCIIQVCLISEQAQPS